MTNVDQLGYQLGEHSLPSQSVHEEPKHCNTSIKESISLHYSGLLQKTKLKFACSSGLVVWIELRSKSLAAVGIC